MIRTKLVQTSKVLLRNNLVRNYAVKTINSEFAPAAIGPYSHGTSYNGLVFVSGQLPIDAKTNSIPLTVSEQTHQSLINLEHVLKAGGSDLTKVLKVNVYLKDMNDFQDMNEVYSKFFKDHRPARAAVEVARLPKDVLVEIECTAVASQ
jgi:2-iminobutanoate/2-iminopropanoate deaminase